MLSDAKIAGHDLNWQGPGEEADEEGQMDWAFTTHGFEIISFALSLPGKKKYHCRISFNADAHRSKYPDHDNDMTNEQLAEYFFYGRWNGWYKETLRPALAMIIEDAQHGINMRADARVKKYRAEYNKTIRQWKQHGFKEFIRNQFYERQNGVSVIKQIKTVDENGNETLVPADIFYKDSKHQLRKYGWTKEIESEYKAMKKDAWVKRTFKDVVRLADGVDPVLAEIIMNPYEYGVFVKDIADKTVNDCVERVKELIAGAKSPDIKDSTKKRRFRRENGHAYSKSETTVREHTDRKNRHYRPFTRHFNHGVDNWQEEGPPLYETGEFADSVEGEVQS